MGQKASKEALLAEKRQAEAQLKATRQMQQQVEEKFASMKASGIGGSELNREIYDRLDDEITAAKRELRKSVESNQRLEEVLVSVRLGAFGLLKRLEPFSHLIDPQEEAELPRTGNTALDALLKSELRLSKMIDLTIAAEKQSAQEEKIRQDRDPINAPSKNKVESWDPSQDEAIHQNNVRVDTLRLRNEMERSTRMKQIERKDDDDDDDDDDDSDDDLLELRGSLKRQSARGLVDSTTSKNSHAMDSKCNDNDDGRNNETGETKKSGKKSIGDKSKTKKSKRKGSGVKNNNNTAGSKRVGGRKASAISSSSSNSSSSASNSSNSSNGKSGSKKSGPQRRSVAKVKRGRTNKRKSNVGSAGRRADIQ